MLFKCIFPLLTKKKSAEFLFFISSGMDHTHQIWFCLFPCENCLSLWSTICLFLQLLRGGGLSDHQFTVAVRLSLDQSLPGGSLLNRQIARTCGASSHIGGSDLELVKWNEMFFFRVDSLVSNKLILLHPMILSMMILNEWGMITVELAKAPYV